MKRILLLIIAAILISINAGCSLYYTPTVIEEEQIDPFLYDYTDLNASQSELYIRARDYFATIYGDSRSVFRVEEPQEGLFIGKGNAFWTLRLEMGMVFSCAAEYDIRFISKDNRARLQLKLTKRQKTHINHACDKWPLPSEEGYETIKIHFNEISKNLNKVLLGEGELDSFKDF